MAHNEKSNIEDPDLELIKARKMRALKEQVASKEKERKNNIQCSSKHKDC